MKRAVSAFIMLLCLLSGAVNAQDANPFIPGKIAYIGSDFNVYTLSGETRTTLTDDAGLDGDRVRYYQFPTWATDGRLAYFEGEITAQRQITTEIFVSADGLVPGDERIRQASRRELHLRLLVAERVWRKLLRSGGAARQYPAKRAFSST